MVSFKSERGATWQLKVIQPTSEFKVIAGGF